MKRTRQGIVLILVLITMVIVTMFLGAATTMVPSALGLASADQRNQAAIRAAEAGVQYALSRIRQNPDWRGNGSGLIVQTEELAVKEDNGNVVGVLRSKGGADYAQFLLRFNHQDDSYGNTDGLSNPARWIDNSYVSVNNLLGSNEANAFSADGPSFAVTSNSAVRARVPAHTLCLSVEGRSGPGLRNIPSAAQGVDYEPNWAAGPVNSKIVEVMVQIADLDLFVEDAVSMSRRDSKIRLRNGSGGQLDVLSAASGTPPRVRSKAAFEVRDIEGGGLRDYVSPKGQAKTGTSFSAKYDSNQVSPGNEDPDANFYQIAWNKIRKADSSSGVQLPSGTYVLRETGELFYYDMNYADYETYVNTNKTEPPGGMPKTLPQGMQVVKQGGHYTLRVSDNVYLPRNRKTLP